MEENREKTPILSCVYRLDKNNVADAVVRRYYSENLKKCIIQTSLLFVLIVIFVVSYFVKGKPAILILAGLDALSIAYTFYMPFSSAKTASARFENGMDFALTLYDDSLAVTKNGEEEEPFSFDKISCLCELENYFYIENEKRFFPIPKSFFTREQTELFRETAKEKLGKRFIDKTRHKQNV